MPIVEPHIASGRLWADPKSDLLENVEQSFRAKQPHPRDGALLEFAKQVLDAVPAHENLRLRTLAEAIGAPHELVHGRIGHAIATAANAFNVTPSAIAEQIVRERTCVGILMKQSGARSHQRLR